MKKNKIINIIIGVALSISLCVNAVLVKNWTDARGQVAVFNDQLIVADDQLNILLEKISDYEEIQAQVGDLQRQLAENAEQIGTLESSLSESNAQIAEMESTIQENNATIAALTEQLAEAQRKTQSNSNGNSNSSSNNNNTPTTPTPINPMPGSMFGGPGFDGKPTGTGDGNGAGTPPPGVHLE